MIKIYEYCYTKRELMIYTSKPTILNKLIFKVINYLANKY